MGQGQPVILVADDQQGVRRLVQEVFREVGYRVLAAANGKEAVELARHHLPAVVLLDVRMPEMDGLEALRLIKAAHPEAAVVMMTAVDEGDRLAEALGDGAHSCISKPFDVFTLRGLVEGMLREEAGA